MSREWLDIHPTDWYYRSVLEADRIYLDPERTRTLFAGMSYNVFESGKERWVKHFVSTEGQKKFNMPGFVPSNDLIVYVFLDGKLTAPSLMENDWIHLPSPIAANHNVIIYITGTPETTIDGCREVPMQSGCIEQYPSAALSKGSAYSFDFRYEFNEVAIALGNSLKRVVIDENLPLGNQLKDKIGSKKDCFTVYNGTLYVSTNLNDFPVRITYNFIDSDGSVKTKWNEVVFPNSPCVYYMDRFFPDVVMSRAEFFVTMERMRQNIVQRYSDNNYSPLDSGMLDRPITDKSSWVSKWYGKDTLNLLNMKFLDGCYVIPLFEDGTADPQNCITRAEMVVYLHRFIEWALERFR